MSYITIGNTVVDWDDKEPLVFNIKDESGSCDDIRIKTVHCNLAIFREYFEDEFLNNLKEHIINRRFQVSLATIENEYKCLVYLFNGIIKCEIFDHKIKIIDLTFLLSISAYIGKLPARSLYHLRVNFNANPYSKIFAPGLRKEDFPVVEDKKNFNAKLIENILRKILTRSDCVEILSRSEQAYEDREIGIDCFSFLNLAFAVYARPDSYRRINLDDLVYDPDTNAYYIYIPPAKSRVNKPNKICYKISRNVGILLIKQRQQVISEFGHLVPIEDIGKLALFPAKKLSSDNTKWANKYANESYGRLNSAVFFNSSYLNPIRNTLLKKEYSLNSVSLRHTIGTNMAEAGCSARTIQAVLKHATDAVSRVYVDIVFSGLVNQLSDVMHQPFCDHLPTFNVFRSKLADVEASKAINSENIQTGRVELTGECGRQIRCQAAPLTCYECNKFIPCYDADHGVNMEIILAEIDLYQNAGAPYRHLVEKAKCIKYSIQLVIAACERYRQACEMDDL